MDEINAIAKEFGLHVIEDAAESMGSLYHGKHTGALGDMGCFSFHGSKTVVMGEGGIFTTNDEHIYSRAKFLGDQAKHPTIRFFNEEVGYKFRLSNLQAAFGLGQMERLEEIVAKKRQVFQWYQEQLKDIKDLTLNPELPGIRNNYWMITPVLGANRKEDAAWLLSELEKRAVSARPFFYPCTELPIYKHCRREPTPVAHRLHERALNLPSGAEMTREEVHYAAAQLRDILAPGTVSAPVTGWLERREQFLRKCGEFPQVSFQDPDFEAMDCEIIPKAPELLTAELLETIHRELGFRRLFLRGTGDREGSLSALGFVAHQKIPMVQTEKHGPLPLYRQPYAAVSFYETVFVKTF